VLAVTSRGMYLELNK